MASSVDLGRKGPKGLCCFCSDLQFCSEPSNPHKTSAACWLWKLNERPRSYMARALVTGKVTGNSKRPTLCCLIPPLIRSILSMEQRKNYGAAKNWSLPTTPAPGQKSCRGRWGGHDFPQCFAWLPWEASGSPTSLRAPR